MQLRHIGIPQLIAEAGGDLWSINSILQSCCTAYISDLAQEFYTTCACTTESSKAFDEARRRFEASWNRNNGGNPINDSAEIQRTAQSLGAHSLQLAKIGVDRGNIATALAAAQRTGATHVGWSLLRIHHRFGRGSRLRDADQQCRAARFTGHRSVAFRGRFPPAKVTRWNATA